MLLNCSSCNVRLLLVTAKVVPSSPILFTLIMEALQSSESWVLTRVTWRNIPEDGIVRRDIVIIFQSKRKFLNEIIYVINYYYDGTFRFVSFP
jgi:hypothetical protein